MSKNGHLKYYRALMNREIDHESVNQSSSGFCFSPEELQSLRRRYSLLYLDKSIEEWILN